ncbi:MAG: DNA polymerase IV, partial [Methanosarcinaceae archaeon]|nr:DNA polymerase IV [Methanosarcinaceae archaeon]
GRGVVSTCSYEAREYGIHSAMPISKAYRLCPDAKFLRVNMPLYKHASVKIMEVLREHSSKFQQVSIDEAYLDVTDMVDDYRSAAHLAHRIKDEVHAREGITCSIGIAPNKVVAKIASDIQKPDGLTIVRPDEVQDFLFPLKVSRIPGVGKKTYGILRTMGVMNIGDLASCDVQVLLERFGKAGLKLSQMANGVYQSSVLENENVRSISKEDTFDQDTADRATIENVLTLLAKQVHRSLTQRRYLFRTVTIKVRFEDFTTYTRSRTIGVASNDLVTIQKLGKNMFHEFTGKRKIRLVGIGVTTLEKVDDRQTRITDFL